MFTPKLKSRNAALILTSAAHDIFSVKSLHLSSTSVSR